MSIFIYNILQFVVVALFWPFLLIGVAARKKYRRHFAARLGWWLSQRIPPVQPGTRVFWVHALSVGEVTSAVPLVSGIREMWPGSRIVITVTTTSGIQTADRLLIGKADYILSSPIDIRFTVSRFIRSIAPDVFIQVETDFWPNQLQMIKRAGIPSVLVNGRISQASIDSYRRLRFFFGPMFRCFTHLCMQTERDKLAMAQLGLSQNALHTLGNLKLDTSTSLHPGQINCSTLLPPESFVITAGSTHPGEEEIIIPVYNRIRDIFPDIYLVIVPRDPGRAEDIRSVAENHGLRGVLRSSFDKEHGDILIVDTIGELIGFYGSSRIGFVGGSLVAEGGHNPIEPALFSIPVIFGSHMEDFHEISADLENCGGGATVRDARQLEQLLTQLLQNPDTRLRMGKAASTCIENRKGVVDKHLALIASLL